MGEEDFLPESRARLWTNGRTLALAAIVGALATLALRWPGSLPFDALNQLEQARSGRYSDGNPPFMAALWRMLGPVPQTMLIVQVGLFWAGLGLLASTVRGKWAFAVLAMGLSPLAIYYNGIVQKDSLLTAFFLLAAGLMARRLRWPAIVAALFGAIVRANGGFAVAPLIFRRHRHLWALPIALLMIGAVSLSSRYVFNAEREGLERGLQLYDTVGIAFFSEDRSALPVEIDDLGRCYTPFFWDTLGGNRCDKAFSRVRGSITDDWLSGINSHPLAYLQHRIAHFNRAIFFVVPPAQQCDAAPEMHDCNGSNGWRDLLIKNAYFWPCVWIAVGLALLLAGNIGATASSLCLSGLFYGGGYLLVSVASDFRYFYWTEISIQIALLLAVARGVPVRWPLLAGGSVVVIGYAARLAFLI